MCSENWQILLLIGLCLQMTNTCDFFQKITVTENTPSPSASLLDVFNLLQSSRLMTESEKDLVYLNDRKKYKPFSLSHGKLIITGSLDRESVCSSSQTDSKCCQFECCMYIGITIPQSKTIYIRVDIEDENDNEPVFPQQFIKIRINENIKIDSSVSLPKAEDRDSPKYSIDRYVLIPDKICKACFQVKTDQKDNKPSLYIKTNIDRETNAVFNLQVLAIDRGSPPKTGTLSITVEVEDVNDNPPQFEDNSVVVSVAENSQPNSEIKTLRVTDLDIGQNSQLFYEIEDFNSVAQQYFKLVSVKNGVSLQLFSNLDYEKKSSYEFRIIAKDQGNPSLSSTATVSVIVKNVNDEPPEIQFYQRGSVIDPSSISLQQPENGLKHQTIILIHVSDKDSKQADISCEVAQPKEAFYLREHDNINIIEKKKIYELQNSIIFDREVLAAYRISIMCSDSNSDDKLTSTAEIQLTVIDRNDNSPVFNPTFFFGKIRETDTIGQHVEISDSPIQVTDEDAGINNRIMFSLADIGNSTDSLSFTIEQQTPKLKNAVPLDYEKKKEYTFFILAIDKGTPPQTSSARITIRILDANDNRPEIQEKFYSFTVKEEQQSGTYVGQITAADADSDPLNKDFIFEIVDLDGSRQNSKANRMFLIENNTGKVKTRTVIDREKDQQVSFLVKVRNTNEPAGNRKSLETQETSVPVNVKIEDINDNNPRLVLRDAPMKPHGPSSEYQIRQIEMNTDSSQMSNACTVFPYTFVDDDEGDNADIKVTLKQNPNFHLEMGHSLICPENPSITPGIYTVTIIGVDQKGKGRRTEKPINIRVKNSQLIKPQTQSRKPRNDPDDRSADYKTIIIFIVLIATIIIFCLLLILVIVRSRICFTRNMSPQQRKRDKSVEKEINVNTSKAYAMLLSGNTADEKRLCEGNSYLTNSLNNNQMIFQSYSNNLVCPRSNTPNADMTLLHYPIDNNKRIDTFSRSCEQIYPENDSQFNADCMAETKYEQLQRTLAGNFQSNNTIDWDKSNSHHYNYLIEPKEPNNFSDPVNASSMRQQPKPDKNTNQKSINDVYLQTSFV